MCVRGCVGSSAPYALMSLPVIGSIIGTDRSREDQRERERKMRRSGERSERGRGGEKALG